jgi:hypothetical protein
MLKLIELIGSPCCKKFGHNCDQGRACPLTQAIQAQRGTGKQDLAPPAPVSACGTDYSGDGVDHLFELQSGNSPRP